HHGHGHRYGGGGGGALHPAADRRRSASAARARSRRARGTRACPGGGIPWCLPDRAGPDGARGGTRVVPTASVKPFLLCLQPVSLLGYPSKELVWTRWPD